MLILDNPADLRILCSTYLRTSEAPKTITSFTVLRTVSRHRNRRSEEGKFRLRKRLPLVSYKDLSRKSQWPMLMYSQGE